MPRLGEGGRGQKSVVYQNFPAPPKNIYKYIYEHCVTTLKTAVKETIPPSAVNILTPPPSANPSQTKF